MVRLIRVNSIGMAFHPGGFVANHHVGVNLSVIQGCMSLGYEYLLAYMIAVLNDMSYCRIGW